MKKNLYRRGTALLLAACLLLSCAACGGGASATAMHLRRTEGTVGVSDDAGKDVKPRENLGLYSGYGVDTDSESYAWIDLDDVKLTKLDQNSEIEIKKEDKHLEIEVLSGSLFFNVTEPLKDDETMEIRSSTMAVGIRGTCGWVNVFDKTQMALCLLEGSVECTVGENSATVHAFEMAIMTADGQISVINLQQDSIPAFVRDELIADERFQEVFRTDVGPVVTLNMPVTVGQMRFYLTMDPVETVIVQPGAGENTFVVGEKGLTIPEGKSLIFDQVVLQADGVPPVITESGGETRSVTVYNLGTLEVRSDVVCNGDISNLGTMKVDGSFLVSESGHFWNGGSSDYKKGIVPQISVAQGMQCFGELHCYGTMEGGLTLIGGRAELTGTIDTMTVNKDSKVFFYGVDIGRLVLNDLSDDSAHNSIQHGLTAGTLVVNGGSITIYNTDDVSIGVVENNGGNVDYFTPG